MQTLPHSPIYSGIRGLFAARSNDTARSESAPRSSGGVLFIQRQGGFHRDRTGSLALGARHGAYCVGCCWALMALLFVGGVMNVLWIAAIAILVLAEKIIPAGRLISRIAGTGCVAGGIWLLAIALHASA
jgi:predicted metal-binding membrane protein